VGGCGLGPSGSGWGQLAGCCEHDNEPSFIKCGECLEYRGATDGL
jgi:hypothetical protein